MQMLGINLRICKKPYLIGDVHFEENGYVYIAEDINIAIKLLSSYNTIWCNKLISFQAKKIESNDSKNKHNKHTLVVIDSIKNPFESLFLKQRYSNYYLLGIYTEDDERKKRLEHKGLNRDQVKEIDTIETLSYFKKICKEYVDSEKKSEFSENNGYIATKIVTQIVELKLNNVLPFILQNVSSCLDSADIFINNIKDNASRLKIKYELIKYVSLAMHPGLILPTHLERCMQIAYTAKLNSGCISRQVGAVITDKDYHLLSIGWNQQPEDQIPCSYRNLKELINHWSVETYSDYENDDNEELMNRIKKNVEEVYTSENNLYKNGKLPYYCFKDLYNKITNKQNQVHPRSLHAEETAFLNLGPTGKILVKGGCLFTTSSPCELCSKKAKYMEISKIYYIEPYSGISYKHVLCAGSNESRPEFILFTGAIGRAYMQLYTPLLPLKDEHELWLGDKTENIVVK
jgi:dCMP deaminase